MVLSFIGLAAVVVAWLFFRKPGVTLFVLPWPVMSPTDYFTDAGFVIWLGGIFAFLFGAIIPR